MSKTTKKKALRASREARGAAPRRDPEIPVEQLEAMELALIRHSLSVDDVYGGPVEGCHSLDPAIALEIQEAIALLRRILTTGKLRPRPLRTTDENLLATAVARDIIRIFKVTQEVAVEAAFPNPNDLDRDSLARTYRNLLPKLTDTDWRYFAPPNVVLTKAYAAGLSKKPLNNADKKHWAARAQDEFRAALERSGKINRR